MSSEDDVLPSFTPSPEEIEAGKSPRGGWTKATLAGWGIPWPPPHGWKRALEERYWREQREEAHSVLVLTAHDGSIYYFSDLKRTAPCDDVWCEEPIFAKRFTDANKARFITIFGNIPRTEWMAAETPR